MDCSISSIYHSPVKSLSFEKLESCIIQKNIGILNDRLFAFSRNIDFEKAKLIEKIPIQRKLHYFLSLKNTPILNKYNFNYDGVNLTLNKLDKKLITVSLQNPNQLSLICKKLVNLEKSLTEPIYLLKNKNYPFFDTTHSENISNTISLINLNSIIDFEIKYKKNIEFQRFRANFYVNGINSWEERKWINKIIKINNVLFKVNKHIPRCSATNLQPNTDNVTINLPSELKKNYKHIDMGIYLTSLSNGKINIGDKVVLDE